MSGQGHALPKQLAQAAAQLGTAGAGDLPALVDLVHQAVAAVTAPRGCQLSLKDRLACCQLLEQLLQTPVEAGHVSALQQQPTNAAAPSTQALFQQVLGQLPGLTLQQQQQQPQLTQPASSNSCLVLQLVHQQEPGACLHLPALLQSAAEQLQEASAQEPGGAKWLEGQAWQLGQQLLQLAATTAEQAVQQQLVLASSAEVQSQLFLRIVDGLHAALAVAEGAGGAAVAAVMSAAELVFQSLVAVQQLGLLDSQGCCTVHRGLLQLVMPPVGSAWPDLSCPDTALQPPVAGQAAAALEQCHPQRLQVLSLLLRQEDGASWEHLTGLLTEDPASASTGWDVLLQLVLSVLQAVAALQAAATATAAAAAEATARQAAKQEAAHDTDSEQDYFHDIFGSEGADDDGSRAAAAAADSTKPAATHEQALCQLAAELLTGLAAHMSAAAPGSSSWGTREQRMLQLAMCCVALDLPQSKQQDEEQRQGGLHSLAGVQQTVQDAVVQWCGSSTAAAQQLQQVVLLTAPAAGHARSPALVHVAAQVVMQHAAAAAAGDAELREPLLRTPWVHLATQLARVVGAAANTSSSVSVTELQQQLAWLLCPRRLSLILAAALAAPAAERALLAAVMLHALERCSAALAAVTPRIAAQAVGGPEQDAAAAAGDAGSAAGLVSPYALALCALHACLSALLWLLLPPALLPTGWLQRHLQSMLQAPGGDTAGSTPAAEAGGTSGAAVQLRREPWPVGLAWVAALLQYKHDTDELPTLLDSLGVSVDGAAQEALAGLLPGFVPSCLPGMAAAGNTAAAQEAAQRMQDPFVLAAALPLLQDQHSSSGASCSSVLTQLLDSVLPAASAVWASNAECSSNNVAAAVAQSCCQERALQLLLVLQDQRQQGGTPAAGTAAGGFNMFGSYQHLVQLQQQLAQLLAECATLLQDSSSSSGQLIPCRLSLTASSLTLHQLTPPPEQQPAVAAVAARLAGVLAGALSDAVQRFRLCDSDVSTPRLLRQQLHTCCAEIELLGHTMQAARVLLLPHLPELLPLLSQLQWQVAHMQLRCLSAALSTCYSSPGSSRAQQAQWLQVLLTLCTDVDYAADAVDAVHEGLGYCLLASLCDTHGPCWPSTAEPSEAVAAMATAAAALQGASAVEAAAARCVAELMVPGEPARQPTDWLLLTQELDLLHSCLAPVPLPQFWPVSSLNRASGCIAAVGACLAASAALAGKGGRQQPTEQEQPKQEASAPAPTAAAAAVAEWMLSMEQLELQLPLLLRPLQLQHAHLLEAAAGLAGEGLQAGSSTAAAAAAKGEPKGVEAVLVDVSAALGAALREAAAAGDDGDLSAASALAAAAVSRLRDAAEGADGYGACASLHDCSTAAQLVQSAEQQQQQEQAAEQHGGASVLQQLWHCVAIGLVQTSRVVDLVQQVTGALHGSDDPQAQALHDSFLQQLRTSLLKLPQQRFDQLLLQQLSTRDAFASNGSGVCRELWQQLLGAEEPGSGDSAVQLLQRLLAALLQLTFSTKQADGASGAAEGCGGSGCGVMGRKQLAAVSSLLGVVMTYATALGLPGVLACCTSLKALAAASADWADASACGSSTEGPQQTGCAEAAVAVTERLVPFLPLLLFVQRVVSQSSTGTGRASSRSRAVRKSDSAVSRSSRGSVGFSAGGHSQTSETGQQQVGSRRSSSTGDAQEASAAQAQQEPVDSDASTVSGGPFEAAASSLVLQDDAVQVLGGAAPAAHFEEEEDFLDEFEDEEEYLAQLLHNGALAAAAGGGGDAQQPGGAGAGAPGAAAAAPQAGDRDGAGDATSDEDASSSDSDESAQEEGDNPSGPAQPVAAPGGSSAAASAAPAGGAAAAAAAAAGVAFGAAGEGVDDDEQALLDEEFAALLQELLAAGAAPDVALAAVTAATGMAPPAAAVAAATEAAAASGDDEMVAVVEQLAAGAAAAAAAAAAGAAGEGAPSTAATSHTTSPVAARQAGASAGREQGTGTAAAAGAGGGSSSSRRARHRRGSSDSGSRYLPQLRRYWRRTHHQQAESAGASSTSSGPEQLHCTFAVHGDQFVEQHWYQCYTCGLTDSRGCCSACVRTCHAGHDVVYAAKSRFFCDCGGENGPRGNAVACKCLTAVPVSPLAPDQSSSSSSSGAGGSSSSSSLVQQGWLLPAAANPLARAGLAASLPDPLDAAWAFDPQLYPDAYAAATGSNGSSSKPSSKQQASAELLLHSGAAPRAQEQHAAAAKLVPQGLVAKAARALAAGSDTHAVLQDVAGSALQLSQLLLSLLRSGRRAESTSQVRPVLPAVLQTKELVMEASSSSTKVLTKASTGSTDKAAASSDAGSGGGSSGSSGAQQQQQQQPLVDLQRVIRLGTMSSSSSSRTRTRSSSDYGADSSSSGGSRGPEVPPEVTAALEGGVVCQQSAAAARQGQLLAVCRGESVGLMDGRLLAAELCGRDIFSKEEISAAVALTSKALSPSQAPGSSSSAAGNDAGGGGSSSGAASSYFYVRRHAAKFHVLALHWDLLQGRRLLVVGCDQVQVWSVQQRDLTIADRLPLQLPLMAAGGGDEAGRVVSAAAWLPDSDTWVAVSTPLRVFLFDLTHSASQPAVVVEPQGHVLLSGGAAFVPRLVQQQQQRQQQEGERQGQDAEVMQPPSLQQQLYVLLLTRDGQLLSAELPPQLLDRQQSCATHWPHASCLAATSSSAASQGPPAAAAAAAGRSVRPSSSGEGRGRDADGDPAPTTTASSSSSVYGCPALVAQAVTWPSTTSSPQLQTGRSCHWLQAYSLLAVAGTWQPPAAAAAAGDSADSSSAEAEEQQLLLQLDATCTSVLQCCRWDTAAAAAPILGSPKSLLLSPASVYWDLPLLPAARASYGAAQLFAVAPGQARKLLHGTGSSTSSGQGCAYIAGLMPTAGGAASSSSSGGSSSGTWQAVVQPLHLRHSSAGAVVDGLAVLSFPYTQQLLVVVLCSMGNMYMYATRRPPGLAPMQPFTQLLRTQLTAGPQQQQQSGAGITPGAGEGSRSSTPAAAAAGDAQQGLSRRAAAVALATGALPDAEASQGAAASDGTQQQQQQSGSIVQADASILLLQHSQNLSSHLSVSGDISRAGSAEAAARALFKTPTDPERRLEGPSPGVGMTLVVKLAAACDLQPVGLKLLLPGGGAAPTSVKLTFGDGSSSSSARSGGGSGSSGGGSGRPNSIAAIAAAARSAARAAAGAASGTGSNARSVQLAAPRDNGSTTTTTSSSSSGRHQRWHQVIFSHEESAAAAAAGQVTLEFGPPVEPERRVAVCHLDLFGQPGEVVAQRAKQQLREQEEEQVLSVDTCCTAAGTAVPAVLMSAGPGADAGSSAATASLQLLLNALLQTGAAAAAAAAGQTAPSAAAVPADSSKSQWQQQVLAVVRQLLCPDAQAAAVWSPSWQCEAAAHALADTAADDSTAAPADTATDGAGDAAAASPAGGAAAASAAALAVQDSWKLSQAVTVLREFGMTATPAAAAAEGGPDPVVLDDAAVFGFLHAMAQLQSVLQVRPGAVVDYLRQHSSSSGSEGLAACASIGLVAAVFALKQLSSATLLPCELLAPLAKTAVELWLAEAAACQQQQEEGEEAAQQRATAQAAQGLLGLLLSSDAQVRLHVAAAWVQAVRSSSSSRCAVFAAAAGLLLAQQQVPCSQLLPAYQAVADVATHLLRSAATAAAAGWPEGSGASAQAVAQVVQVLVQQLSALQQQQSGGSLSASTAEQSLLLQLLLARVLSAAWEQQQQQQQAPSASDGTGSSASGGAAASSSQQQQQQQSPQKLHRQLLPPALLQQLAASLLSTLQSLVPLLHQQQQSGAGGVYTVLPGEGAQQAGPGGYNNYQALLPPPPAVSTWGVSRRCCQSLLGAPPAATAAIAVTSSSSSSSAGEAWLLDPFLQGGQSATRLLQGLPLQLAAAAADLTHSLLQYGLVGTAVGSVELGQVLPALSCSSSSSQLGPTVAAADTTAGAAGLWCGLLCHLMDLPSLHPVRRLAKQVVLDMCGNLPVYREVRSLHLLSNHTAALCATLGLPQQQQQQQQQQEEEEGEEEQGQQAGVLGVAAGAVAALQASWQQQCAVAACLVQLLSVAESQPVAWAHVCSSSSSSAVVPLLMQLALACKVPQLSLTAVKLVNAALVGAVKAASSSSNGRAASSKGGKGGSSAADATQQQPSSSSSSSSSSSKASSARVPVLDLSWLLPQQQQPQQPSLLSVFIDRCVVGWPEVKERREAAKTLVLLHKTLEAAASAAASGGSSSAAQQQGVLLQAVLQAVPPAGPLAGAGSLQLFSAANQLLKLASQTGADSTPPATAAAGSDQGWSQAVSSTAGELFAMAAATAAALAVHPCGLAYQQLQELMEFQQPGSSSSSTAVGYWLELCGCDVAGGRLARKPSNTAVRLDSIAAELKFGDRQVMARLAGWYSVHKLLLVVHSPRKSKAVSSLRLWYCDSPVSDLQQLKQQGQPSLPAGAAATAASASAAGGSSVSSVSRQPVWKLAAAEVPLSPGQTEVTVSFELPLLLSCLMVEFAGFHVSVNESSAEVLHCPRCSHVVTDKHGLCGYCRENAYQCRQCRHINYEAPDAFICSECGHSRYGRFELLLQAGKAPACPPLLAQANLDEALSALDTAAAAAAAKATALQAASTAVQQQAAALATAGFHHTPDARAAAAAAAAGSSKRGSSGGASSSSAESLMRPGLRHLAELYTERCKPAFEEALQAVRAHAAVRSAIAEAEAATGSSNSSSTERSILAVSHTRACAAAGDAGAAAAQFGSCSYGHTSAVLSASINLLRGALAAAPAAVTAAAQQQHVLPDLLALLAGHGSMHSLPSVGASGSSSSSSSLVSDVRSLLLGLCRADPSLHDQLLTLLQQQLLAASPAAADSSSTSSKLSGGVTFGNGALSGHQLQLLLMVAQHDVQHLPKDPTAAAATAAAGQRGAAALKLVLQLLQLAVAGGFTEGLWPELLLLPGLKVMAGTAAVQQQLAKAAAAQAAQDAADAAAAASAAAQAEAAAAAPAAASQPAATADSVVEVLGAASPGSPQVTPAAAAAEEGLDVLDATVLSDAEAERLEQRKIAEYLSKKGPGSSAQLPSRAAPGFLQQQQRQQQRQRGYGQGPLVAQQQLPVQRSAAAGGRPGGGRVSAAVDAEAQKARQHKQQQRQQEQQEAARKAQSASAAAAEKAAASAAAAAALPGFVSLQELLVVAQQLLLHPHSVAVRKESAALLLQLQPDPLARLQQLQEQLPAACAALAHSTPGAVCVPGTELCALLMETVAELLVLSCRGSSPPAVDASSSGGAPDSDSSSRAHTQASAVPTSLSPPAAAAKTAQVSATTARAALSGLLAAVCQQLVGQVSGLLQQEQQLWPGQRAPAAPARTAALPMLLEQVEQLLIGLAQLQPHHHHHHHHALSPRHHTHHHQQQQGVEGEGAAGWVDAVCLQQLLWSVGGLDALTAGRTAASQAAAEQLHRLLKQGWLQGGAAAAGQAGGGRDGTYGDSDSAGDEVEDEYTEADEYETELEGEEDEGEGEEEGLSEFTEGHEGTAAGGSGGKLLSRLPALSADVLAQRQAQLVEALVRVLASELRRYDQQQQQLSAQPSVAPAAAAAAAVPPAAAAAGASSGLSWRSSLALCSSLVVLLCSAVSPEKPPPSYQLLLEKAATQEEFIPGQLPSGGLVTSATLAAAAAGGGGGGGSGEGGAATGPLMRDVKNYICRRLDMTGLLDDDFGMELLVGGSLISLALPVLDVLTHHWGPLYQQQQAGRGSRTAAGAGSGSSGGGGVSPGVPMPVTFRLSGLDGEATEPQVKELNPGQAAGQNPDEEAVLAGVLARGQGTGLGLLLQLLLIAHQQPVRALRRVSGQLLQLLKASVGQAECRQQLLQQGALGCLLHLVHLAVKPLLAASSSAGSRGAGVDRTASLQAAGGALGCGITGAQLLLLLEALQELVTEANRSGQPVQLGAIGPPEAAVPSSPLQRTQQQQQRQAAEVAGPPAPSAAASPTTTTSSSSAPLSLSAARVSSSSTEVAQLADGLSVLEARGLGSCAAVLAKLLTALAQHSSTAQLGLIKHFAPALDLQALDEAATAAGGADATAGAAVGAVVTTQAEAAPAAQGAEAAEGSGEEEGEAPLLAAVHAEAGGAMSVHEHCLQLKAFLRLIEALSNSTAPGSSSSSGTMAAALAAAGQEQQAGSTAAVTDFKQLVLEQGVPGRLADYLLAAFTPPAASQSSSSGAALLQPGAPAWAAAAARPGVPFALQLLTALAQGHARTAAGLAAQQPCLLQLLHLLEGTAGGSTITPLAEACLEALARAGAAAVAGSIADLRAATAAEMKARAARKRAALLASMGMVQVEAAAAAGGGVKIVPSPGAVPALSPLAAELAALEGGVADDDEGGNVCMVCREGYALQPTTLLGCYCFCRVAAAAEWPGCGPPWGTPHDLLLTTVSHFNLIHTQCHAAAKAADASLRQPKREWQGATLRNGNVLCNSLLPLAAPAGGKVETAYAAAVTSFWQQQLSAPSAREAAAAAGSSGGTGGGSGGSSGGDAAAVAVAVSLSRRSGALREADSSLLRMSLVAADLATLLWRFSAQLSFSEEARGGGRASNARLLFALLQLGRYYLVEAPTSELRQAQKLLAAAGGAAAALGLEAAAPAAAPGAGRGGGSNAAVPTAACSADDLAELSSHAPFVLALSLLCMGPAEWMAARRSMLVLAARAGAARALQQQQAAGGDSTGGSSHRRSGSGAPAAAGAAGSSSGLSDEALYAAAAPMLRLFGFVDWLHQWAKPAVGSGSGSGSGGSSGSGGWGGAMAQQLADLAGCAQAAGELLEVADEAEGAFGLQDLLDGLGCLGVALGPRSASVEEFLRGAVAGL